MDKADLLTYVKHLSQCRHEDFARQIQKTPSLYGHMLVESGCLDVADAPYSAQLMRKAQSVIAALDKQKPVGVDIEGMIESLLGMLDKQRCNKFLVGLCFVVCNYFCRPLRAFKF
jgi:hypothetical protein